ncbi:large subunit ribosomal protein L9 [Sporomusaceae bacterium BoRhaA]|uniref:50S ribosomal protein L9 n=1 Tax=Pelorhabdus rhamnosifermentans TaxID=2772457 RepID=UPI001C06362A|nr:50S ribosomal protein L9 [Pelorhabdus rhamnosifermentans]MBU2700635.1 large subunit ribosomal protein L9 [Pelorhabdus rhamnosifermentans]
MKLILQQEVKKLGNKGDIIDVSEGYARNFLLPKKLAVVATSTNVNSAVQKKAAEERKSQQLLDEAKVMAAQLTKVSVTVEAKLGNGGKLFGSITAQDVADALKKQYNIELDKRKIEMKDPVKSLGVYQVTVKIHAEVTSQIEMKVVAKA